MEHGLTIEASAICGARAPERLNRAVECLRDAKRTDRLQHAVRGIRACRPHPRRSDDHGPQPTIQHLNAAIHSLRRQAHADNLPRIIGGVKNAVSASLSLQRIRYERLHRALAGEGVPLGALSVCGRGTREIRYTSLLRYFLDPHEPHGLGSRPLREFLSAPISRQGIPPHDVAWETGQAMSEVWLGNVMSGGREVGCNVDLHIVLARSADKRPVNVFIEQKLLSSESGSLNSSELTQLRRYSAAIKERFPGQTNVKLYLTPDQRQPKDGSDWVAVSHRQLIARLSSLYDFYDFEDITPIARHNLSCLLWDLLSGPLQVTGEKRNRLLRHLETAQASGATQDYLRLERWCNQNLTDIEDILRVVEVNYGCDD